MKKALKIAKITGDNDQERAACDEWIRTASSEEILVVWLRIQRPCPDAVDEIISRFAQLAFAETVVRVESERGSPEAGDG